jgi:phosphate transport system substrate-binding protein
MSDADIRHHPQIINVPMAISAQLVVYNIPGINTANVKLDGPALAGIYTGKIRTWDDKAIAALIPGVAERCGRRLNRLRGWQQEFGANLSPR